jgi:iturin family lipopeptide synthetase A
MSSRPCVLSLSAADEEELRWTAAAAAGELREVATPLGLADPNEGNVRLLARGASAEEVSQGLAAFASGRAAPSVQVRARTSDPLLAFVFAGQSETRAGMGHELYRQSPCFAAVIDRCSATIGATLCTTLVSALYDCDDPSLLDDARLAQPALFALQSALVTLWKQWGVAPDMVAGHSLGEYAAACAAGVISLDDGARLVATRGELTQSLALPGRMAVVFSSEEWVTTAIASRGGDISLAAVNAPGVAVISGEAGAISEFLDAADAEGISAKALNISHPFHSRCIEPMLPGLEDAATKIALNEPRVPFASTLEGRLLVKHELPDAAYWRRHAREPVQFLNSMRELERAGCTLFLELGPHATLTGLGERCVAPGVAQWLPSLKRSGHNWQVLTDTAAKLWFAGVNVRLPEVARSVGWTYLKPASALRNMEPSAARQIR